MYITNVSQNSSPCWLIRTSDVTLLLDCGLDYSPLYQRRFNSKIQPPLFKIPNLDAVCDLSNVDAILVTNYHRYFFLKYIKGPGISIRESPGDNFPFRPFYINIIAKKLQEAQ